jgi:hypothetical protein
MREDSDWQNYLVDPAYSGAFTGAPPLFGEEKCLSILRDPSAAQAGGWQGLQRYLAEGSAEKSGPGSPESGTE